MSRPRTRHLTGLAVLLGMVNLNPGLAQAPATPPKPTSAILGQIIDGDTGKPVAGATVRLAGTSSTGILSAIPPDAGFVMNEEMFLPGVVSAGPTGPITVIADADGRYVFRDLARGSYSLSASLPGYISGSYGRRQVLGSSRPLDVADNQFLTDVTIRIWKFASISGTVLDEYGEPAVGVSVRALRRTLVAGRPRFGTSGTSETDDRGAYRIGSLAPGEYLIVVPIGTSSVPLSAVEAYRTALAAGSNPSFASLMMESGAPSPSGTGLRVGDAMIQQSTMNSMASRGTMSPQVSSTGEVTVYQTVYHPSATSIDRATTIAVRSGDERTAVDLQLRSVPTRRVFGRVTGPNGPAANLGVKLTAPNQPTGLTADFDAATALTDAEGRFTFVGVPVGQYVLRILQVPQPPRSSSMATTVIQSGSGSMMSMSTGDGRVTIPPQPPAEPTLWAEMAVSVGNVDVKDLGVTLMSGARLRGQVVFEGSQERPSADSLQRISISLTPVDGFSTGFYTAARPNAEGQFTTAGYPPGRYHVSASTSAAMGTASTPGRTWTVKSIAVGGRDAAQMPIELTGTDISGVVVTYTDQVTEISGTVTASEAGADVDAQVVVFPADYQSAIAQGMISRRMRTARTSASGAFRMANLLPGDYIVAALPADRVIETQDPQALAAIAAAGSRVTVALGQQQTVTLRLGPGR